MKRVIVTGAAGFIGRNLVRELAIRNYEILAAVRRGTVKTGSYASLQNVRVCEWNMEEYGHVPDGFDGSYDAGVLLAWNGTRGSTRDDARLQRENYVNSINCVKTMIGMGCHTIISAGSQAEYGRMRAVTTEESECAPDTEYGRAKLLFYKDAACLCKEQGVLFREPRFFSLYGEDDSPQTMILSILSDMIAGRPCALTQCVQEWNFLHIDDAVCGLILLLEKECADGAYNFASEDTRMLKEFVMQMYEIAHSESELHFGAVPYPDTGMVSMHPCADRLKRETGWKPQVTFQEGIQRILQAMRKDKTYEKNIRTRSNL